MTKKNHTSPGDQFNGLTAIRFERRDRDRYYWRFKCKVCGSETVKILDNVKRRTPKSCGCANKCRNGLAHTSEYKTWERMVSRCLNPKDTSYRNYGGRGVQVCDAWLDFNQFFLDMGQKPDPSYTLERVNNDGHYCPENVIWADRTAQCRNRRTTRFLEYKGQRKTLTEWSEETKISYMALVHRVRRGWSTEDTLTKPARERRT